MRAVLLKRPNGTWSPPFFDEQPLRKSVILRMRRLDGPFVITEPGVGSGPKRPKMDAIDHFVDRLMRESVGTHLKVTNENDKGVHGRVVETAPDAANTSGSPGVDLVVGFLNATFGNQWDNWGIYVYKHISGSGTWSDHSYINHVVVPNWCGRAIDVHPHSMTIGDSIKAAVMQEPAITSNLRYLLWRVPDHYDHLHFSMDDYGTPGDVDVPEDPVVVVTISIGAVLIATLLGLWLRTRNKK